MERMWINCAACILFIYLLASVPLSAAAKKSSDVVELQIGVKDGSRSNRMMRDHMQSHAGFRNEHGNAACSHGTELVAHNFIKEKEPIQIVIAISFFEEEEMTFRGRLFSYRNQIQRELEWQM